MWRLLFIEHPASVGETYGEHLAQAAGFGGALIVAGCACLVHAVFPALFTTTASREITRLRERMIVGRQPRPSLTEA